MMHAVHTHLHYEWLQLWRRRHFATEINSHASRQLLYQGYRIGRIETRLAMVVGSTPAYKAQHRVGLFGIDPRGAYKVWIGRKLGRMQVAPLMKSTVAEVTR